jgi:hypothetical protein
MKKRILLFALLCAASPVFADTLTPETNQTAYDYALAMFGATEVSESECPAEQKSRTGFFYLCGKTALAGDAFEAAWIPATRDYGATDLMDAEIADDAWESTGAGGQGLEVVVEGEFILVEYGPDGAVSVRSSRTFE